MKYALLINQCGFKTMRFEIELDIIKKRKNERYSILSSSC